MLLKRTPKTKVAWALKLGEFECDYIVMDMRAAAAADECRRFWSNSRQFSATHARMHVIAAADGRTPDGTLNLNAKVVLGNLKSREKKKWP
jgi:hypothetical protein